MTDKELMQQARDMIARADMIRWSYDHDRVVLAAIDEVLARQEQEQEPVAHSVVAGALFDFMGWLTTRSKRLVLSSTDDAAPAADAIKDFAHMRSLNINDAQVQEWQKHLAPQPAQQPLTDERLREIDDRHDWQITAGRLAAYRAVEAAHGITGEKE